MTAKNQNNREAGKWLSKLRKYKNLTQQQLADACGVSEATIKSYELARRVPPEENARKILQVLGVSKELWESHVAWFRGTSPPTIWEPWNKPDPPYTPILLWIRGHWRDVVIAILSLLLFVALVALFRRQRSEIQAPQLETAVPTATLVPTQPATAVPTAVPVPTRAATAVPTATLVPTQPATAVPTSVPVPTQAATAVPYLTVRRVQHVDNVDCVYLNIKGISAEKWTFSIDGPRLTGHFDSAGNGELCGISANRALLTGFTFTIFDAQGSVVQGGQGIQAIGGDIFEGDWR